MISACLANHFIVKSSHLLCTSGPDDQGKFAQRADITGNQASASPVNTVQPIGDMSPNGLLNDSPSLHMIGCIWCCAQHMQGARSCSAWCCTEHPGLLGKGSERKERRRSAYGHNVGVGGHKQNDLYRLGLQHAQEADHCARCPADLGWGLGLRLLCGCCIVKGGDDNILLCCTFCNSIACTHTSQ